MTGQNGSVIDLQAMLADLELLVNTESPSLDVPRLTQSAAAVAGVLEARLGGAARTVASPAGPHVHWSGGGTPKVLIVGHQPSLGRLASLLLAGHETEWSIKKGALWWLSNRVRRGETQTVLRAMIPVELLD